MALSMVTSRAEAVTVNRFELLQAQVLITLLEAGVASEKQVMTFLNPGMTERWITGFRLLGLDGDGQKAAQLDLTVDWTEHLQMIEQGQLLVEVNPAWEEEQFAEIAVLSGIYYTEVQRLALTPSLRVILADPLPPGSPSVADVWTRLDLVAAEPTEWAGEVFSHVTSTRILPELTVGCQLLAEA